MYFIVFVLPSNSATSWHFWSSELRHGLTIPTACRASEVVEELVFAPKREVRGRAGKLTRFSRHGFLLPSFLSRPGQTSANNWVHEQTSGDRNRTKENIFCTKIEIAMFFFFGWGWGCLIWNYDVKLLGSTSLLLQQMAFQVEGDLQVQPWNSGLLEKNSPLQIDTCIDLWWGMFECLLLLNYWWWWISYKCRWWVPQWWWHFGFTTMKVIFRGAHLTIWKPLPGPFSDRWKELRMNLNTATVDVSEILGDRDLACIERHINSGISDHKYSNWCTKDGAFWTINISISNPKRGYHG